MRRGLVLVFTGLAAGCGARTREPQPLPQQPVAPPAAAPVVVRTPAAPAYVLGCSAPFSATVSLAQLTAALAAPPARPDSVPLGATEGEMMRASTLYPGDRTRRVSVVWRDTARQRSPRFVYVRGVAAQWKTAEGVSIGTSLRDLETLNGRPFTLAGFGFDGAGAVTSWNGGQLAHYERGPCHVRVWVDSLVPSGDSARMWYRQLQGDGLHPSTHPAMQGLNPRVSRILVEFP